jgi:hypothetical protein
MPAPLRSVWLRFWWSAQLGANALAGRSAWQRAAPGGPTNAVIELLRIGLLRASPLFAILSLSRGVHSAATGQAAPAGRLRRAAAGARRSSSASPGSRPPPTRSRGSSGTPAASQGFESRAPNRRPRGSAHRRSATIKQSSGRAPDIRDSTGPMRLRLSRSAGTPAVMRATVAWRRGDVRTAPRRRAGRRSRPGQRYAATLHRRGGCFSGRTRPRVHEVLHRFRRPRVLLRRSEAPNRRRSFASTPLATGSTAQQERSAARTRHGERTVRSALCQPSIRCLSENRYFASLRRVSMSG